MPTLPDSDLGWPVALASVLERRCDIRAGLALDFGLPAHKHFRIR